MQGFTFKSSLVIVCGHFGAGKTNISVNLALELSRRGGSMTVVDFDTVNPFFRTKDAEQLLIRHGISSICPDFANTNVDIPAIPAQVYSIFERLKDGGGVIIDVGGDALGATALGFLHEQIVSHGYEMLYVYNRYRPITSSPPDALEIMRQIEHRSRLLCTCLVNNSNLGAQTTAADVCDSFSYQRELEELSGLQTRFTAVRKDIVMPDTVPVFGIGDITRKIF